MLLPNASHGGKASLRARPVTLAGRGQPLSAQLAIATWAQHPSGPLVDQGSALVIERLRALW